MIRKAWKGIPEYEEIHPPGSEGLSQGPVWEIVLNPKGEDKHIYLLYLLKGG